jgi:hypothetical protein
MLARHFVMAVGVLAFTGSLLHLAWLMLIATTDEFGDSIVVGSILQPLAATPNSLAQYVGMANITIGETQLEDWMVVPVCLLGSMALIRWTTWPTTQQDDGVMSWTDEQEDDVYTRQLARAKQEKKISWEKLTEDHNKEYGVNRTVFA